MVTGIVIKGWLYDHEKIRRICCLGEGIQAGQHNGIHNKVANSNNLYVCMYDSFLHTASVVGELIITLLFAFIIQSMFRLGLFLVNGKNFKISIQKLSTSRQ